MFELSRHIETLLLKHDCVIIPGFGGFIAQNVPARYVIEEELFLPPSRCVCFNERLNLNDGVLVQSYMKIHQVTYSQALLMIEQAVANLKQSLNEHSEMSFGNLGMMAVNQQGSYSFIPTESGITTPELYGLDSFIVAPKQMMVVKKQHKPVMRDGSSYVLQLNKELVNYVAAIFVAVMFYFAWATPLDQVTTDAPVQARVLPTRNVTQDKVEKPAILQPTNEVEESLEEIKTEEYYSIVLASCIPMKNATNYIETLKGLGLDQCEIYVNQKMVRVVYGIYTSESEAYIQLQKLRTAHHEHFASAWVLKIKETRGVQ